MRGKKWSSKDSVLFVQASYLKCMHMLKRSAIKYTVVLRMTFYEQCKNTFVTSGQNSLLALFQFKSAIKPLKF